MRKAAFILIGIWLLFSVGCYYKCPQDDATDDVDTSVFINDSFAVIYDMITGKDSIIRVISEYEVGDMRINDKGDTLFYIPDCVDVIWATAVEWHSFWEKQFKILLDERKERRIE